MNVFKIKYPINSEIENKIEAISYDKNGNLHFGYLVNDHYHKRVICENEDSIAIDITMYIPLEEVINHFEQHL